MLTKAKYRVYLSAEEIERLHFLVHQYATEDIQLLRTLWAWSIRIKSGQAAPATSVKDTTTAGEQVARVIKPASKDALNAENEGDFMSQFGLTNKQVEE